MKGLKQKEDELKTVTPAPIILYWDKKIKGEKVKYFHNGETGKGSFQLNEIIEKDKSYSVVPKLSRIEFGYGIIHDKKQDILIFNLFSIDTRGIKPGTKLQWEKISAQSYDFGLSRSKEMMCLEYLKKEIRMPIYKYNYKFLNLCKYDVLGYDNITEDNFIYSNSLRIFEVFFGSVWNLSGNHKIRIKDIVDIIDMIKYKEPKKKSWKKQELLDELVSQTSRLKVDTKTVRNKKEYNDTLWVEKKYSILEKIETDKPCCVLRTFVIECDDIRKLVSHRGIFGEYCNCRELEEKNKEFENVAIEGTRIYFYDKDVICCKPNNMGEYIVIPLFKSYENWNHQLISYDENAAKGTKLEYLTSVLSEFKSTMIGYAIWAFIDVPVLETLYKAGYKNIVKYCINNVDSPADRFLMLIGDTNSDSNLYKKIGINKYQLEKVNSNIYEGCYDFNKKRTLRHVKRILLNEANLYNYEIVRGSITNVDNKTFDFFWNACERYFEYSKNIKNTTPKYIKDAVVEGRYNVGIDMFCSIIAKLYYNYNLRAVESMIETIIESAHTSMPGTTPNNLALITCVAKVYYDYLTMAVEIKQEYKLPYKFETCEQLKDMHDSLLIIYNQKKFQIQENVFTKKVEKLEKYKYENDTCMVVAPKHAADLIIEGNELRHCVKAYIQKVVDGNTNIMFIRKKDDPDKPFFTVEISNNGEIEQVHGFANCNADSDPLVSGFMNDWLKTKKVSTHGYNKVR